MRFTGTSQGHVSPLLPTEEHAAAPSNDDSFGTAPTIPPRAVTCGDHFRGSQVVYRGARAFVVTTNRTTYADELFRATTLRGWPIAHGPTPDGAIDALLATEAA
jgi:hypothetical protein